MENEGMGKKFSEKSGEICWGVQQVMCLIFPEGDTVMDSYGQVTLMCIGGELFRHSTYTLTVIENLTRTLVTRTSKHQYH